MIQSVVITYWFGSSDCYARVDTSQSVETIDGLVTAERSADYTLSFANLTEAAQADFAALYAAGQASGDPLQAFLDTHGLTLGDPTAW